MDILFTIVTIAFFLLLGYLASVYIIDAKQGSQFLSDTFKKTIDNEIEIESNKTRIDRLERQLNDLRKFTYATRDTNSSKNKKD